MDLLIGTECLFLFGMIVPFGYSAIPVKAATYGRFRYRSA